MVGLTPLPLERSLLGGREEKGGESYGAISLLDSPLWAEELSSVITAVLVKL